MLKKNLTIVVMVLSVIFAIAYNRIQFTKLNIQLAVSYFITHNVEPYTYMDGINISKPVRVFHIKKGDTFIQYQIPGAPQGNFYGLEGSTPSELGINEIGWDEEESIVTKKELRVYVATKDFDALSSYAAAVVDDWSTPEDETQTEGSAIQLFTTCKPCLERK